MKQIFDWLREQYMQRKALWEDKSVADRFSAEKHIGTWNKALELLDIAEDKWKAECCKWIIDVESNFFIAYKTTCGNYVITGKCNEKYCRHCGKPIKISEVE